jgi:hypothetical protein
LIQIKAAALAIIGEVVGLRQHLDWFGGAKQAREGAAESVA